MLRNFIFYALKPTVPRRLQVYIRKKILEYKLPLYENIWPIDKESGDSPLEWNEWPEKKRFSLVLTHDVEKKKGQNRCKSIIEIEKQLGFKSSFNFVPERYVDNPDLRAYITKNGFEVGVHDLNHDGKLFSNKKIFDSRKIRINSYLRGWNAVGFRAGAMHHNLDWIGELELQYDCSTFDTDPFEPQPDGVRTIFPFWVNSSKGGYVEMPYTLPQDFTLFVLLREKDADIWKRKLDWIVSKGGMALVNTHPDYMYLGKGAKSFEEYPVERYIEFLEYVKESYGGEYWNALPKEIATYYRRSRQRNEILDKKLSIGKQVK